MTMDSL